MKGLRRPYLGKITPHFQTNFGYPWSPKSLLYPLFLSSSLFLSPLTAQSIEQDLKKAESTLTQAPETKEEKQKRIAKAIVSAAERTAKSQAKAPQSEAFKRVLAMRERQAEYQQKLLSGETRPFPEIVKQWPEYEKQLAELITLEKQWLTADSLEQKQQVQKSLLDGLDVLGNLLKNATHAGAKANVLNDKEQAELKQLDKEFYAELETERADDASDVIHLQTPNTPYTLKNLPVPIVFSAPKGTEIILSADTAGRFSNQLPKIKIIADSNGVASTWWLSTGDAVGTSLVTFKSSEYTGLGVIQPIVKRLELIDLEMLSPVVKKAEQSLPR